MLFCYLLLLFEYMALPKRGYAPSVLGRRSSLSILDNLLVKVGDKTNLDALFETLKDHLSESEGFMS